MKIKTNQKASVSMLVIVSLIFLLILIVGIQYSIKNKQQAQVKEVQAIKEQYNKNDIDSEYNKIITNK